MYLSRKLITAVVAVIAIAAASTAFAAIPDAGGLIHSCFKKSAPNQGTLRLIDTAKSEACGNNETSLNWNQQGPQGPQGLKGDTGPQGQQGAQGPAGPATLPTAYITRVGNTALPNSDVQLTIASLNLPAGNYLVSVTAAVDKTVGASRLEAECSLWKSNVKLNTTLVLDDDGDALEASLAMSEAVGSGAGLYVYLACDTATDGEYIQNVRMTATQVQSVVTQ